MKSFGAFLALIGVLAFLYFGYIFILGKIMHQQPTINPSDEFTVQEPSEVQSQQPLEYPFSDSGSNQTQEEKAKKVREEQKLLMEQRRERIRDMQRR